MSADLDAIRAHVRTTENYREASRTRLTQPEQERAVLVAEVERLRTENRELRTDAAHRLEDQGQFGALLDIENERLRALLVEAGEALHELITDWRFSASGQPSIEMIARAKAVLAELPVTYGDTSC